MHPHSLACLILCNFAWYEGNGSRAVVCFYRTIVLHLEYNIISFCNHKESIRWVCIHAFMISTYFTIDIQVIIACVIAVINSNISVTWSGKDSIFARRRPVATPTFYKLSVCPVRHHLNGFLLCTINVEANAVSFIIILLAQFMAGWAVIEHVCILRKYYKATLVSRWLYFLQDSKSCSTIHVIKNNFRARVIKGNLISLFYCDEWDTCTVVSINS